MRWFWFDNKNTASALVGLLATTSNTKITNLNNDGQSASWKGKLSTIPRPTMVTWLIDGNNLSCSRAVPNERDLIIKELRKIASPSASSDDSCDAVDASKSTISNVVLVFDGNEDEIVDQNILESDKWFRYAITDGKHRRKDRADDYIIDHAIPDLQELVEGRLLRGEGTTKVNLVSADKGLQRRVQATRVMNGGSFVHPPKFWKEYLPILQKQQQQYKSNKSLT